MPDRLSLGDGTCPTGTAGAPYYCVPGNPGRDTIVGGSGSDTVTADRVDRIARDCE